MSITVLQDSNGNDLTTGVIAIHAALVPKPGGGAAIVYFGTQNQARYFDLDAMNENPTALGTFPGQWAFCSGHAFQGDGRWIIAGGIFDELGNQDVIHGEGGPAHDSGDRRCEMFSPRAGEFTDIAELNRQPDDPNRGGGRWYPTALTLANGQVFVIAGHPFIGSHESTAGADNYKFGSDTAIRHNNNTPERYVPREDTWIQVVNESTSFNNQSIDEYPRVHLTPSGHVFFSTIAKGKKRLYNALTGAYTSDEVERSNSAYERGSEATSVVLPILPTDLDQVWVLACGDVDTEKINVEANPPVWEDAGSPPLGAPRAHACATILPTGSVFLNAGQVAGFAEGGHDHDEPDEHPDENPPAELYHPPINWDTMQYEAGTGSWEQIDTPIIPRGYHFVQLLLPDGRVWIAGSTWQKDGTWPQNGVEMEVYTPEYYVDGRFRILNAPASAAYQSTINVTLDSNTTISRAVMIRCGSVTHAFDSDQRYVACQFQQDGTRVQVKAPVGPGVAPPGNYMLFLLDDTMVNGHGRPCMEAPIIRLCDQFCEPVSNISKYSSLTVAAIKDTNGDAIFPEAVRLDLQNYLPHEIDYPNQPAITLRWDNAFSGPVVGSNLFELQWLNPWAEDNSLPPDVAQRFSLRYDVKVNEAIYDSVNTERNLWATWDFGDFECRTMFQISTKPNPFMVDVKGGNPHWLSTDLRVFSVRAGATPPAGALPLAANESPFDYLQKVVNNYNLPANATDNPFDELDTEQVASALSLQRTHLGSNIYNFAIARVRYIGLGQNVENVRVLFRMFNTVGAMLEYDTDQTYRRKGIGPTAVPLLGKSGFQTISIPFFDKPRVTPNQSMTKQPPDEAHTLQALGATEHTRYFGVWLDINQHQDEHIPQMPVNDGPYPNLFGIGISSIKELIRGYHQCLVAEVHHLDDLIPDQNSPLAGTPANSDNLSQRNLALVPAGNPGSVASRTVQTTFWARPSGTPPTSTFIPPTVVPKGQILTTSNQASSTVRVRLMPDELIFDGTDVPDGTKVTLYWPDVEIDEVIELTRRRFSPVKFTRVDEDTISFEMHGTTYVPLPGGRTAPIPGLLSAELPPGILAGQVYKLLVHQFSGKKKRVIGTFELRIPVAHEADLLEQESIKLSLLRWIGESILPADAWYPIFKRYLGEIADRVTGFGGDPSQIDPHPDGRGYPGAPDDRDDDSAGCERKRGEVVEGKVTEVHYDCYGDFSGFTIDDCGKPRVFESREPAVEELVLMACEDRTRLAVEVDPENRCRFVEIRLLC